MNERLVAKKNKRNQGQAVTEYAVLLMVLVGAVVTAGVMFKNKLQPLLNSMITAKIRKQMQNPESGIYKYRLMPPRRG